MAVTKPSTTGASIKDLWITPMDVVKRLEQIFYIKFDVDVAGDELNKKAPQVISAEDDGLAQDWTTYGRYGFMNPPFSVKEKWIAKAEREARKGFTTIGLLPVAQCANWYKEMEQGAQAIYTPDKRISYIHPTTGKQINGVSFETIVAVWRPKTQIIYNRFSLGLEHAA